jgi:hypothetical protein
MTPIDNTVGSPDNSDDCFIRLTGTVVNSVNSQTAFEYITNTKKYNAKELQETTQFSQYKTVCCNIKTSAPIGALDGPNATCINNFDIKKGIVIPDGGVEQNSEVTVDLAARDIYRVVCNHRRRETIRALSVLRRADDIEVSRHVPVRLVACAIVAVRENTDPGNVDSDDRSSTYVTLTQTHLPLLDRFDLVVYYDRPKKVEITPDGCALAELLVMIDNAAVHTDARIDVNLFRDASIDNLVSDR